MLVLTLGMMSAVTGASYDTSKCKNGKTCTPIKTNCKNGDYKCIPIEETLVKGKITYDESGDLAGKAKVEVTCYHNGNEYTRTTTSLNAKPWKGWYFVYFPQSECVAGDTIVVKATKGDLTGVMQGTVEDFVKGKCFDLDLARIDVPLVPEFGTIIGIITALGALGVFFIVRRSN